MNAALGLFPLIAPLALVGVVLRARREPGARPRRVLAASRAATLLALGIAVVFGLLVGLGVRPALHLVRFDGLAAVMFALVSSLGAVVVRFSRRYLAGDRGHGRFVGGLCLTVATVLVLVVTGDLVVLVTAWIASSFALHQLLVFYPERRRAALAARKKFLVARGADACLVLAVVLLVHAFGTTDLGLLVERARGAHAAGELPGAVTPAALLVALAAALKSAQFPAHGWLAEVMETPTPVSALLHAGILNGGPFLVVRLADVVLLAPTALQLLVLVGGTTATLASVARVTQPSVKVSLAYSSAAHMGFTLLLCGLGAFPAAILHLVAHSFYKAHAFLSSGSIVDLVRAGHGPPPRAVSFGRALVALALALLVYVGIGLATGARLLERPATSALGVMLVLALTHLLAQGLARRGALLRTLGAAAGTTLAFLGLERVAARVLERAVPVHAEAGVATWTVAGLVLLAFTAVTTLQLVIARAPASPLVRAAWVHARNGFYANAVFDRLLAARRRERNHA